MCVYCRRRLVVAAWRPFCSERCRLLDLGNWVGERYRVPGEPTSVPSAPDHEERGESGEG